MKTTVQKIWQETKSIQSFLEGRRICLSGMAQLNGNRLDFIQELDVKDGDVFSIRERKWMREGDTWIPFEDMNPNVHYKVKLTDGRSCLIRALDGLIEITIEGTSKAISINADNFPKDETDEIK